MRVIVFRPKSLPLNIKNAGILRATVIKYKKFEFIKYSVDFKIFLEDAYKFLSGNHLKDIPQLVYILDTPSLVTITDEHSVFNTVHIIKNNKGYFTDWLISNNKYFRPSSTDIVNSSDLLSAMYEEYQSNKLLESL